MQTVLFVLQTVGHSQEGSAFCGAGLRGALLCSILRKSTRYQFIPCVCDSFDVVEQHIRTYNPVAIVYNYHPIPTPWIAEANVVKRYPNIRHFRIHYDLTQAEADGPPHVGNYVITDNEFLQGNNRVFVTPRATPPPKNPPPVHSSDIPIFGFQGFLFERKGLVQIAESIKREFDTAILRVHGPPAHFCRESEEEILARVQSVLEGTNIRLEVSRHFMNDEELVEWLSQNTINCYFYHDIPGSGIASAPDYAIAARRPIAVVRSNMLANIWKTVPSSLYGENTLKQIIDAGIAPLEPLYARYSEDSVRTAYETMLDSTRKRILYVGQSLGFRKDERNFCGIGLRGKLTTEILAGSTRYEFIPCFCESFETVDAYVAKYSPEAIVFNYHPGTCSWVSQNPKDRYPTIPTVLINVDMTQAMADEFCRNPINSDYMLCDDETRIGNPRVFVMPRSTPVPVVTPPPDPEVPTIGFQGFPAPHKGIHELAHRVKAEFDTAIIRLHMPPSHFGDPDGSIARRWADDVRSIVSGTNIRVESSHDFKTDEEIIEWLSKNSVNCYFYNNDWPNAGPASSPDYALAARRPIAVRDTVMMTNITRHTSLATIETSSLREIIARGIDHLKPIYERHSREAVVKAYEDMCDTVVGTKAPPSTPDPAPPSTPDPAPPHARAGSVLVYLNRPDKDYRLI